MPGGVATDTLPDGSPLLVMEYPDGRDLEKVVGEPGWLPVTKAVDFAIQACEGLSPEPPPELDRPPALPVWPAPPEHVYAPEELPRAPSETKPERSSRR